MDDVETRLAQVEQGVVKDFINELQDTEEELSKTQKNLATTQKLYWDTKIAHGTVVKALEAATADIAKLKRENAKLRAERDKATRALASAKRKDKAATREAVRTTTRTQELETYLL